MFLSTLFHWGVSNLSARNDSEVILKGLIINKFDANLDGVLADSEKDGAISFLKRIDTNSDGELSDEERAEAIAKLKQMSDLSVAPNPDSIDIPRASLLHPPKNIPFNPRKKLNLNAVYPDHTIIAMPGFYTVVAKGSVLYLPPSMTEIIVNEPIGEKLSWIRFLNKYSKLIATRQVSYATAKGDDPIKEKERKAFADEGKLVVAIYGNTPIPVMEPDPETR